MKSLKCEHCGAPLEVSDTRTFKCPYCGTELINDSYVEPQDNSSAASSSYNYDAQQEYTSYAQQQPTSSAHRSYTSSSGKSKMVAGLLGILLGSIGVHHFYLGKMGRGILYLVFSWTGIPAIIGLIEGIMILTMSDSAFENKYS